MRIVSVVVTTETGGVVASREWTTTSAVLTSLFAFADPPFPERVFVQEVNGHKLDEYGMAKTSSYFEDPVRFDDLFFLSSEMGGVEVKVCS